MYQIPNVIEPLPDELFISYLKRLAAVNGTTYYDLLACYCDAKNGGVRLDSRNSVHHVDEDFCLQEDILADALGVPLLDLVSSTSILPALYPFMDPTSQDRYFHTILKHMKLIVKKPRSNDNIKYCPLCHAENQEQYGSSYLSRTHSVPGVKCCHIHHIPLLDVRTNKPATEHVTDFDIKYSGFMHELLQDWIITNFSATRELIMSRYRSELQVGHEDLFYTEGFTDFFFDDPLKRIPYIIPSAGTTYSSLLRPLAALLFDNVASFKALIPELPDYSVPDAYELLDYDARLSWYRCKTCGNVFWEPPHAVATGWMCPKCAEKSSDSDYFGHIASVSTNGHYTLIEPISDMAATAKFIHSDCGNIYEIRARDFLFNNVRCHCNLTSSFKEIDASLPDGFKLIHYQGSKNKKITVKAIECGHEFDVIWRKMLRFPGCRICQQTYESEPGFLKTISDLVGDEYKMISPYTNRSTPVVLKHKRCGYEMSILPKHFIVGQRCPVCTPHFQNKEQWIDYIDKLSSGRYAYVDRYQRCSKIYIKDQETGKEYKLSSSYVVQELTRPTPSKVLPHKQLEEPVPCLYTRTAIVYDYLFNQVDRTQPFTCQEFKSLSVPASDVKRSLAKLVNYGILKRVDRGVYEFVNKEKTS